jgi:cellulose synthase/poly-beta-1,6-N-acetylglucosamine synthase-like glycosyltransferase
MTVTFYICLGVLGYVFFLYPALLWFLSLALGKKPRREDITPKVTLLISAYNEKQVIVEKLENSLSLDYPEGKLEIIVASESKDETDAIVAGYEARGVILHAYDGREGKAATLYRSVPRATGEIIVFSDANAIYEKDAIRKLVRNFNDERIGCVSGQLRYRSAADGSSGAGEGVYWKYEMALKSLESRFFSLLGANGSIFAIRKALYAPMARDRGDDFELPIRVLLNGRGVYLEREALSWEDISETARDEFKRKVRIITWNMRSCVLLLREAAARFRLFLAVQLLSHKLLRWIVPVFAIGLLVSNAFLEGTVFRTILAGQALFYCAACAGYVMDRSSDRVPKLLLVPYYFCLVHCAALASLYRLLLGEQKTLWEKVRS